MFTVEYSLAEAPVQLSFFGTPRFRSPNGEVEVKAAKAIALLAYLALSPRPKPREHLLALLWAESAGEAARKNLRNTLWTLRKLFGSEIVAAQADRLALLPHVQVDVRAFEALTDTRRLTIPAVDADVDGPQALIDRLHTAITLYRGPFLDDLGLSDAPEFETWMTTERGRLRQRYIQAQQTLLQSHRVVGNWQAIRTLAQQALQHDPLQESLHRSLMEAQARLGEREEALRQYKTLRTILQRELGIEPLPETRALHDALVQGEITSADPLSTSPDTAFLSPPPVRQSVMGPAPQALFVGRRAEWDTLDTAFQHVSAGNQARIVALTGAMGMGKSRLWQEWSQGSGLATGGAIQQTRCLEATQRLPFAPLVELLRRQDIHHSLSSARVGSPMWLTEISRLLPDLFQRPSPAPVGLPAEEERRRLFEALVHFLCTFKPPLLLFIDDLHWADTTTLDWLAYLVHRLQHYPLLLVVAYRPEEIAPVLFQHLAQWQREHLLQQLELSSLTEEDVQRLVAALGADDDLTQRASREGAGNPYFLIELSQAPSSEVPPILSDLIGARLKRLPEGAQQLLQAGAILEPVMDFASLQRVSGRSEDEVPDCWALSSPLS